MVFPFQQILHCLQRGACRNEIVEDDAVRLLGQDVQREHRTQALFGVAERYILIERNCEQFRDAETDARGKVADEMSALGRGDDTPIPFLERLAQNIRHERSHILREEGHHLLVALDVRQRPSVQ